MDALLAYDFAKIASQATTPAMRILSLGQLLKVAPDRLLADEKLMAILEKPELTPADEAAIRKVAG